jgi:hypothetical protein
VGDGRGFYCGCDTCHNCRSREQDWAVYGPELVTVSGSEVCAFRLNFVVLEQMVDQMGRLFHQIPDEQGDDDEPTQHGRAKNEPLRASPQALASD